MEFEKRKAATLASISSPEPDKSPKGTVDVPIIPLLRTINCHPSFFTTSSCSGRISIFSHSSAAAKKKASKGGQWVFITHDPADPDSVLNLLFPPNSLGSPSPQPHLSNLVFRFEPLIIAVEAKDVSSAQSFVSLAISCGFRESGITSAGKRVILAIRCSIRLEVPLGDSDRIFVSPEYVRLLVDIANEKMEANKRRTDGFLNALLSNGFGGPGIGGSGERVFVKGEEYAGKEDGLIRIGALNSGGDVNVLKNGDMHSERIVANGARFGPSGDFDIHLPVVQMMIDGEPLEKLFLWGHSACTLDDLDNTKVLIFGGFGGMGRHSRRNDSLLLDSLWGKLKTISIQKAPCPRLGHTSSMVGDLMFLIGGRADPVNILNDVWALDAAKGDWKLLECTGTVFPPRHRHAATVTDSKIYVFGGLNGDLVSSALYVLDTFSLEWNEIHIHGEWPCARHSHTMVASGSKLFMFGGFDGEKALGDFYSFDTQTCLWKKETVAGQAPYARFSHSMFVYKNYLGIIGGCPVRQHCEELSLLDLQLCLWKHVILDSVGKNLFVRCTASVVGDDLVVVGGGASCYAFGTTFCKPTKVNLIPLMSLGCSPVPTEIGVKHAINKDEGVLKQGNSEFQIQQNRIAQISNECPDPNFKTKFPGTNVDHGENLLLDSHWVLKLERKHAKLGKDILKKFEWLDLGRKVYSREDGVHICFPVTQKFLTLYCDRQNQPAGACEMINDLHAYKRFTGDTVVLNNLTSLTALNLLIAFGATTHVDEVKLRKISTSPLKVMSEAVASLVKHKGLPAELLGQLPTRWELLGDIVVLPVSSFKDPVWDSIGDELWPVVAKSLGAKRLARQGQVAPTGTRDSTLEILVGKNGWVDHRENGILYSFDSTKCMFSWGNLSEKVRMGHLDCRHEVIVDLFAGIGYFVLPFLVRANAKLVYACEWNPHAVAALRRNLHVNSVMDRCIILEGDNRVEAPKGVADRVCLGLLPTSEGSWVTAVRALRSEGGILHVHGNAKDSEEGLWADHVLKSIYDISRSEGHSWEISIEHVERVKWYAPHIRHLVLDVRCKSIHS
ncbi:tRNA wybutosine-synthesizing protein 2/3/4 isoform X2 [Diospyros lotus]|uniref:tRNA wybutosine-synthesizing protein 2/3/4 isoform X2 n=1 Tax=Diospyros lotus TaxID=55363 RepID=UPI00225918E0|nr:tRNA wybutosine-synthesizing protein 2/3/4 isoform X2 [Diospyros lotus]